VPVLPHHASFPETAAELVLDLTVEGRNAGMAPVHMLCMFLSHTSYLSPSFQILSVPDESQRQEMQID